MAGWGINNDDFIGWRWVKWRNTYGCTRPISYFNSRVMKNVLVMMIPMNYLLGLRSVIWYSGMLVLYTLRIIYIKKQSGGMSFNYMIKLNEKHCTHGFISYTPGTLRAIPSGILNRLAKITSRKPSIHSEALDKISHCR